jgi:N-acetylmuramoyl-L-alanine amidase
MDQGVTMATPDQQRITDTFYLGLVVWREARGEALNAKLAVAYSILNRVRNPKWWGHDISSVVTKAWQYSSMTDPMDPQLRTWPVLSDPSWIDCLGIAMMAPSMLNSLCPGADSYYDTSIPPPKWAKDEMFVAQIGNLKFYNTDGDHPENV